MTTVKEEAEKSRKLRKMIVAIAGGGIIGFLLAMAGMQVIDTDAIGDFDTSRVVAMTVAVIYIAMGIFVSVGVFIPGFGAKYLNVEDAGELHEQRVMLAYSCVGMLAVGCALLVAALAAPDGPIAVNVVLTVFAALFALSLITWRHQLRLMDELMQNVSRESGSTAFYLMLIFGGSWALAAHLNLTAGPAMLDWLSMLAGALLLSTFIVSGKRGMLTPR